MKNVFLLIYFNLIKKYFIYTNLSSKIIFTHYFQLPYVLLKKNKS